MDLSIAGAAGVGAEPTVEGVPYASEDEAAWDAGEAMSSFRPMDETGE